MYRVIYSRRINSQFFRLPSREFRNIIIEDPFPVVLHRIFHDARNHNDHDNEDEDDDSDPLG